MSSAPPLPQLTIKAILLGIVLAMVLAGANAYLGLFAGMTVSASIPAAVISMALLRLFRESNILENNIVQTAASAGEALAAGVIFTLPALVILGLWESFDYWWVCMIAGLGGLLGVMFTIPLRRSLIVEQGLAFPEGAATAEVLRVGQRPERGVRYLGLAALIGGLVKLAESGLRLWPATAQAATYAGQSTIAYIGANLSPALVSVGYIVGLNIALLVFLGGVISWYVAIPVFSHYFVPGHPELGTRIADGVSAVDLAFEIWSTRVRFLGVGAMLVGGIWALISMRQSLVGGIRTGLSQYRDGRAQTLSHTDHDTPMPLVLVGIALFVIPLFLVYQTVVASTAIGLSMTLVMIVSGFLFASVAAYMAGLVGSSNNPISGITIATILFSSLLLLWMMGPAEAGPAAAILVGGVVCCAAAIAGDNMQDLKAGFILGATPWRQQLMQGVGVFSAVLVIAPILNLLMQAYGIGIPTPERPNPLLAPQATLMASVAIGVFRGGLPWGMVAIGAVVGMLIIIVDEFLRASGSKFRAPVLAVAVGIYLPLELSTPILAGGIISHLARRKVAVERLAPRAGPGMLCAAGFITGEALLGIFLAIPIVLSGETDLLAMPPAWRPGTVFGLLVLTGVMWWLFRAGGQSGAGRS